MTPSDEQKEQVFIAPRSPAPFAEVVTSLGWMNPSFSQTTYQLQILPLVHSPLAAASIFTSLLSFCGVFYEIFIISLPFLPEMVL